MDYERETTYSNMYLGNEIRLDGLANFLKTLAARFEHRSSTRKPITAKA